MNKRVQVETFVHVQNKQTGCHEVENKNGQANEQVVCPYTLVAHVRDNNLACSFLFLFFFFLLLI
ncbi:hypothetical protein BDV27DRAFT_137241 [Aspergillus caelatus]|uniref:Uncharacterized protein n=1 Tax=Aspergillus caelatus TaxID=61420 RepID=A0A5N6ZPI0_9EURO|nr:uncharacterized protein BDV27DRAFT_137241 [Aspergillus caelatus]KAE8358749.1 hypothetical protein BDV27DRAFT_137241 [Aspergillus caelatus]